LTARDEEFLDFKVVETIVDGLTVHEYASI
jgi:hypothetical protein